VAPDPAMLFLSLRTIKTKCDGAIEQPAARDVRGRAQLFGCSEDLQEGRRRNLSWRPLLAPVSPICSRRSSSSVVRVSTLKQ
jgi:hypothetical protein